MTTRTKKNELRDIAIVKANPTTIRPAIFSNLEPNDIGFVVEAPRFHRLKPPCQKGIGAPKVEMGFSAAIFEIGRARYGYFGVISFDRSHLMTENSR